MATQDITRACVQLHAAIPLDILLLFISPSGRSHYSWFFSIKAAVKTCDIENLSFKSLFEEKVHLTIYSPFVPLLFSDVFQHRLIIAVVRLLTLPHLHLYLHFASPVPVFGKLFSCSPHCHLLSLREDHLLWAPFERRSDRSKCLVSSSFNFFSFPWIFPNLNLSRE